ALPPYDSPFGGIAAEAFGKAGMQLPSQTVAALTAPARLAFVATGRFLTITPKSILLFGLSKSLPLIILPIKLHTKSRPYHIVTLRGRTPNPIAPLFVNEAYKLVGKLNS